MKDTKKKLVTTGLAVVMAMTTVGGVACAAEPVDAGANEPTTTTGIIQPRDVLYPNRSISEAAEWRSNPFGAARGNGNYIRFWYNNRTSERVIVYLYRTDSGRDVLVKQMSVSGNSQDTRVYNAGNADSGTYYLKVSAVASGGAIRGNISAAQYPTYPTN